MFSLRSHVVIGSVVAHRAKADIGCHLNPSHRGSLAGTDAPIATGTTTTPVHARGRGLLSRQLQRPGVRRAPFSKHLQRQVMLRTRAPSAVVPSSRARRASCHTTRLRPARQCVNAAMCSICGRLPVNSDCDATFLSTTAVVHRPHWQLSAKHTMVD